MKKKNLLLAAIPEIYLILSVIYYWISTWTLLNPIAISLLAALIIQLIIRNRVIGLTISVLFIIVNLYLILALLSEFHEFLTFSTEAKNLLMFGLLYIGLNITMGVLMLIKYSNLNSRSASITA